MYTVTITRSGQVTLPKELRDFLGVKPGQKITFRRNKDQVSIPRRLSDQEFLDQLAAIRQKHGSSAKNIPDAAEAVRAYREGKDEKLNKLYVEEYL